VLVLAGATALAGCSSSHHPSPTHSTPAAPQSAAAPHSPLAPPSSPAAAAGLPRGLAGVWHKKVQGVDQKMALEPGQFRFYVDPADAATGKLSVSGERLTFSDSNTCSGVGSYRFQLAGTSLRLVAAGGDPCPRSAFITGRAWTRSS
jgi:hypothetical protein